MRNLLFLLCLWLGGALAANAETLSLADGTSVTGEILRFDDNGLQIRLDSGGYNNVPWAKFSQESLKQLAQLPKFNAKNPTIASLVEPFIEPNASQRSPKPEISFKPVTPLALPAHPSVIGGLVTSSVGLLLLGLLYLANLYAGFEVAVVRGRSIGQVVGLSAVLPVIGPAVFLALPVVMEKPAEENAPAAGTDAPAGGETKPAEEINIVASSWQQEEKKAEPQVFARGKFTFNKRFIETKFAAFLGAAQGEAAKQFTMELKTAKESFAVLRLTQVTATDVQVEAVQRGAVTVPLTDIQEIKLIPKNA